MKVKDYILHLDSDSRTDDMVSGIQKTTLWLRFFADYAKKLGYCGTWGAGSNSMNNIHVKDVVSSVIVVLKAALEGKAEEGAEGLCESMGIMLILVSI